MRKCKDSSLLCNKGPAGDAQLLPAGYSRQDMCSNVRTVGKKIFSQKPRTKEAEEEEKESFFASRFLFVVHVNMKDAL